MTNSSSPSPDIAVDYESLVTSVSKALAGVTFTIRRMSFARRLALLRILRDLAAKSEYCSANGSPMSRVDARILEAEARGAYITWGLQSVTGLHIDGEPATAESLIEKGPEQLCTEISEAVRAQCFLTEDDRKN